MLMSGMDEYGLGPLLGRGSGCSCVFMDEKCSARMSALLVASLCTTPWCWSGDMPDLSLPVDLMKDQNLFCLVCVCLVCLVRMCSQ